MTWMLRLSEYIRERLPQAEEVELLNFGRMPAGASNETVKFDLRYRDSAGLHILPLVLRPQRQAGILQPYDVARQYKVMQCLASTSVPVPRVYWLETSVDVLGTPFYVMERVPGFSMPLMWYGGGNEVMFRSYASALATVHTVDWQEAGLGFLEPGGATPVEGELNAWRERAAGFDIGDDPFLGQLAAWIESHQPTGQERTLLHGDCNPGNYIFRDQRVVAVVDWELATLGDPRSDLGFYAALLTVFGGYWSDAGQSRLALAYQEVIGRRLPDLAFFEALALFKMAVILAGWQRGGFWGGAWGWSSIQQRMEEIAGPLWSG